ncbi:hypothetical protein [Nocardia sp. N2S4-5]|uniref:hypothetical protein n=1 Tax=Nocardia sp. N2S4-5 TaxID=3351565 RepID=UPI0037CCD420
MMIARKITVATMAAMAVLGTPSTAAADTAEGQGIDIDITRGIRYQAYKDGTAAVITVESGQLTVDNGQFQIRANSGTILAGIPLEFAVDDIAFPIDVTIDGNTATLAPSVDFTRAHYRPAALPFEDQALWKTPYDREVAAWARMTSTINLGAGIGAIAGAVASGALGCLLGGAAGTALTGPLATLFGAGPLAGCLIGAGALAPIGALGGIILIDAPVALAAFIQYSATVNSPFIPAK